MLIWIRPTDIYSVTIMQRPHEIDHYNRAKLLMRGPSENCTTNPPRLGPPHTLEDNLFLFTARPVSHP
ncbi:hypothetical protein PBY51_010625 [Eleginops maclovinus]|uniref:Uncharacterized protein n=1 Tax=Eleginops maclovinus TaxID=56733 RepID=A0AAN7XBZ2_ELEMC|nr:hypothetical protein PBY51_010625 [Eleginops maclovinus]